MADSIIIEELELQTFLGVPEEEREEAQRCTVTVRMRLRRRCGKLEDDFARTVDYAAVARALQEEAACRPRALLETLAEDLAAVVKSFRGVKKADVWVRKYVLPETRSVGVRVRR